MVTVGKVLFRIYAWTRKRGAVDLGVIVKTPDPSAELKSEVLVGITGSYKYGTQGQFLVKSNSIEEIEDALAERYFKERVREFKLGYVLPGRIIYAGALMTILLRKEEDGFFAFYWQKREEYERFMLALAKVGGLEAMVAKTRKPLEEAEISIPPSPYVLKYADPISTEKLKWDDATKWYKLVD